MVKRRRPFRRGRSLRRRAFTCSPSPAARPATSTAPIASSCRRKRSIPTTSIACRRRRSRAYIRQLLESHRTPEVTVAWQGGEPTLMKLEFFERAVELVEKYRKPGQAVQQTFQTNGLLLDDAWCAFFKKHNFLVGLSVDGPRELHDAYRRDRKGQGTFDLVMRGWRFLRRARRRVQYPLHRQRRQREARPKGLPLLPRRARREMDAVHSDRRAGDSRARSPSPTRAGATGPARASACSIRRPAISSPTARSGSEQYGRFLIDIFEEWVRRDVGRVLRPALRRHARSLFRTSSALHPRADLRLWAGARTQRRSLHLRSFRRAGAEARQHPRRRR